MVSNWGIFCFKLIDPPTDFASLQNSDGSFNGDYAGEIDTRFSYCAISGLSLLNKLDKIN